jgi:hypothetical protein
LSLLFLQCRQNEFGKTAKHFIFQMPAHPVAVLALSKIKTRMIALNPIRLIV